MNSIFGAIKNILSKSGGKPEENPDVATKKNVVLGPGKISLQDLSRFPTHVWQDIIAYSHLEALGRLSRVCAAFYNLAKHHILSKGGRLFGHWGITFSLGDEGIYFSDLNLEIKQSNIIMGIGISPLGAMAPKYKIIGCRLGNTISVFQYYHNSPNIFSNQLVTYYLDTKEDTALLKGSFVSQARGFGFDSGKLAGMNVTSTSTLNIPLLLHNNEGVYYGTGYRDLELTTRLRTELSSTLRDWDPRTVQSLLGKWTVTQSFQMAGVQQRIDMWIDLGESCRYGTRGKLISIRQNGNIQSLWTGVVLATINDQGIIGFSISVFQGETEDGGEEGGVGMYNRHRRYIDHDEKNCIIISAIAEINKDEINKDKASFQGKFVSRLADKVHTGNFFGNNTW